MTEPIWPDSVPWATARMIGRMGVRGLIIHAFGMPAIQHVVTALCRIYVDETGGLFTDRLWADAFNWATAQLGYTEDYYV